MCLKNLHILGLTYFWFIKSSLIHFKASSSEVSPFGDKHKYKLYSRMISSFSYISGNFPLIAVRTLEIAVINPSAVLPNSESSSNSSPFYSVSLINATDSFSHRESAYGATSSP
jgi:hypothetical protein